MAHTPVDQGESRDLTRQSPIEETTEAALTIAQAVLDRHSRFTTDPRDEGFCAACVQNNLCDALTDANALIVRHGSIPRRRSPSRIVAAMRESQRRDGAIESIHIG